MLKKAISYIVIEEGNSIAPLLRNVAQRKFEGFEIIGVCEITIKKDEFENEIDIFNTIYDQTVYSVEDYDTIFVSSIDSISNDIWKQINFAKQCLEKKIDIRAFSTPSINLIDTILEQEKKIGASPYDASMKARRTEFEYALLGKFLARGNPFGTKLINSKLYIEEGYNEIIHEIFELYSRGAEIMTISRFIYDIYNIWDTKDKTKGKNNLNNYMKGSKIAVILSNPIYKGYPSFRRSKTITSSTNKKGTTKYLPRKHWVVSLIKHDRLAVISEDLYDKVQERLNDDKTFHSIQVPSDKLEEVTANDCIIEWLNQFKEGTYEFQKIDPKLAEEISKKKDLLPV
jgi:Recombinase